MVAPLARKVSFREDPLPDTRNPRPLFKTDPEQFTTLHQRYLKANNLVKKEDHRILEISKRKLLEFVKTHPEYKDMLPKELQSK